MIHGHHVSFLRRTEPFPARSMKLSPRECEVARLVADDLADKEIATILCISVRTVQAHLDRIAQKIGASDSNRSRRRVITRWIEQHAA